MGEIGKAEIGKIFEDLKKEFRQKEKARRELYRLVNRTARNRIKSKKKLRETLQWASARMQLMAKNIKFKNYLNKLFDEFDSTLNGIIIAGDELRHPAGSDYYLVLRPDFTVELAFFKGRIRGEDGDHYETIDALEKGNGRNHVIAQAILHLISEDAETRIRFFFDKFGPR
jgi:hypothetical protein